MNSAETPTPGPWHIAQADPHLPPYVVSDVTGIVVCDLVGPPDRTEANATLISAAPDLLAALDDLMAQFVEVYRGDGWVTDSSYLKACEAIAKAEGRQP